MPLEKSKSPAAFKRNVRTLMGEVGKSKHVQSQDQALAIAYRIRRGKAEGGEVGDELVLPPRTSELAASQRFMGSVAPHLADPATYGPRPAPTMETNEAGKVPTSDPRLLGGAADIGSLLGAAIPFGGPVAGGAKLAAAPLAGIAARIARGAKIGEVVAPEVANLAKAHNVPVQPLDPSKPTYLRVGAWDRDKPRSMNYAKGDVEGGLSVYDLDKAGKPRIPPEGEWAEQDLSERMASEHPKFLVQGEHVGIGNDGEPLLGNPVVVGVHGMPATTAGRPGFGKDALRNVWAGKMLDDPQYGKLPHITERYKPIEHEWYHGTQAPDFNEFKLGGVKRQTSDWNTMLGPHFSDNPGVASSFAEGLYSGTTEGGRVIPAQLKISNPKNYKSETDLSDDAVRWAVNKGLLTSSDFAKGSKDTRELAAEIANGKVPDWAYGFGGEVLKGAGRKRKQIADGFRNELAAAGHDGIVYGNNVEGIATSAAIPFEPHQIRSRWAAFDPANKGSGNLLASGVGAGGLGLLSSGQTESKEKPIAGFAEGGPIDDELIPPPRNPAMPADWAQRGVMGVANTLGNIVAAPRRAMERGMTTEEAVPWAGETALTLAGAGTPAAVRGAAGIFGGKLAQTADKAALAKAEQMAASGAPREAIWNDTGWFKGGDDKWRFEIPDNLAKLNEQRLMAGKELPLSAHMNHPELYEAYPSLRWADTIRSPDLLSRGVKGSFMGGEGEPLISYADLRGRNAGNAALNKAADAQEKSVLLHEVQHAAQAQEGFARGSNTMFLNPKTPAWDIYQERLKAIRAPTPQAELEKSGVLGPNYTYADYIREHKQALRNDTLGLDRMAQDYAVREGYRRAPGEVEARNVQTRMKMTPEERRAKPPWLTEDVPAQQQIFKNQGGRALATARSIRRGFAEGGDVGDDALMPMPRNPAAPADWAQNAVRGAAGKLADVVMAPKRAMDQGMTTADATDWAGDVATTMAGAGGLGAARGALGAAGGKLVQPQGIRAYHSSPHDFEKFDFSPARARSGEGAQTYGEGGYFAESPAVSGQGGQYWQQFAPRFGGAEGYAANVLQSSGFNRGRAMSDLDRLLATYSSPPPVLQEARNLLESGKPVGPRTYEVNIAARPEQMLDWDKPLAQQSPQVQAPIRDLLEMSRANPKLHDTYTGREIVNTEGPLANYYGTRRNPRDVSDILRAEGIPGIRYLDQKSRTPAQLDARIEVLRKDLASGRGDHRPMLNQLESLLNERARYGDPTRNYVMFPGTEDKVKILKKYGVAGVPAAGAAAAATEGQRPIAGFAEGGDVDPWQAGVDAANRAGTMRLSPVDTGPSDSLMNIGRAGDTLRKNAPLLADTGPGRIAQALGRVVTGRTPIPPHGMRREDYTDDPNAPQPIEPLVNDAMNVADVMSMGSLPAVAMRGAQRGALGVGIPPKEPFRIQPQDIRAPKAANVNTSKAEVLADLPPPLPPSDRIWQNYVKRMGPDEMLKSEPVWSAAENLSAAKGISPSEAFAEVANDMFGRMGANRFMTPAQAKMHMARERGVLVPVPAEGLTMKRPISGFAAGGSPDFKIHPSYIARAQSRSLGHTGPISSMVPGRTDHHAMSVPRNSYVVPADIASGLGQGNTAAGMKVLGAMFPKSGPYGSPAAAMHRGTGMPRPPRADGGAADGVDQDVPIYAAGGEFVVHPDDVADVGGGDHKHGHAAMDAWVKAERAKLIKTLRNLPGPAKD